MICRILLFENMIKKHKKEEFYGMTTLGEKGQVVIPADARIAMGLKKGEKLLVFGLGGELLAFAKISDLKKFASHLSDRLDTLQEIMKKNGVKL